MWCVCGQLFLCAVVDYVADFTVSQKDFEVVKHDLSTTYINQSLKPDKLNELVVFTCCPVKPTAEYQ